MVIERWRHYGAELRRLRQQAGLTQRQLANRVGLSHAMVGAMERAIRTPNRDFSDALDTALATGGVLGRIWHEVSGRRDVPEWFRDALALELQSNEIREFESLVIPGLLQTHAYATSLESAQWQRPDPKNVSQIVETRLGRLPAILDRGTLVTVVIPEKVLRHKIGDSAIMRQQLGHIIKMADANEILIQILTGAPCLAAGFPFRLMALQQQTVAYAESADGGAVVDHPDRVARLATRFVRLQSEALPPSDSVKLIRKLEENYA